MTPSLRPMISSLLRNRTGAILVALQLAIALAVMVNAAWIVRQRIASIEEPTGLDYTNMFVIGTAGLTSDFNLPDTMSRDLAYLRSLPGVEAASPTFGIPLTIDGEQLALWREPGQRGASVNFSPLWMDGDGLRSLGVRLLAGRNFRPEEILPVSAHDVRPVTEIIVTRALAHALFPRGSALGKAVYDDSGTPMTIIGIMQDFMGPTFDNPEYVALYPQPPGAAGPYYYLVHTRSGKAEEIMRAAVRHLAASNRDRAVFDEHTLADFKRDMDAGNRTMAVFLVIVTGLILAVTSLGIFGLATFNVAVRTRQIGTRRAVGARKRDIIAYFMLENAFILAVGVLAGCALTLAVGHWLTTQYDFPRLDPLYLLGGVAVLAAIGQLAAWQPARRAAAVPPSVASRTV